MWQYSMLGSGNPVVNKIKFVPSFNGIYSLEVERDINNSTYEYYKILIVIMRYARKHVCCEGL